MDSIVCKSQIYKRNEILWNTTFVPEYRLTIIFRPVSLLRQSVSKFSAFKLTRDWEWSTKTQENWKEPTKSYAVSFSREKRELTVWHYQKTCSLVIHAFKHNNKSFNKLHYVLSSVLNSHKTVEHYICQVKWTIHIFMFQFDLLLYKWEN